MAETLTHFTFSKALEHLKLGKNIQRKGWNGKGMFLELQTPDKNSKMTLPYIYMNIPVDCSCKSFGKNVDCFDRVPWLASQTDILSQDWVVVGFAK